MKTAFSEESVQFVPQLASSNGVPSVLWTAWEWHEGAWVHSSKFFMSLTATKDQIVQAFNIMQWEYEADEQANQQMKDAEGAWEDNGCY